MNQEIELINKNTRNEKIKNFFKNNYKKIITFFTLVLIGIIGFFALEYFEKKKNLQLSNKYNKAITSYKLGQKDLVLKEFEYIINKKNKTYSPLSLFFLIDNNLETSKEKINNYFDKIINEVDLEGEIKNLTIYKKALFISDFANEDELINTLNPIINSESIWKSHSLYLIAEYFFSKGEKQKAKEFFEKILKINNANHKIKLEAQKRLKRDLSD
tara:strand:- start:535 stop:1179 length:645 start_codon:yes stop_codon:yes gene_type:complete